MKLVDHQQDFLQDFGKLIAFIYTIDGLSATMGEAWRPPQMQEIYYNTGKSKTLDSQHGKRLAIDLNFFMFGKLLVSEADHKKYVTVVGDYWESLNPLNCWGGRWGWDYPHFERKEK